MINSLHRDVFPHPATVNALDVVKLDSKHLGSLSLCHSAFGQTNTAHHLFGQNGLVVNFSVRRVASALTLSILIVVVGGAFKQMARVTTGTVIATVQNVYYTPNSCGKEERKTITAQAAVAARGQHAVPVAGRSSRPAPTIAIRPLTGRFVDVRPETLNILFGKRWWSRIGFRQDLETSFRVASGSFGVHITVRAKPILA